MYNAAQIIFAILGFLGVGWFALVRLLMPKNQEAMPTHRGRTPLLLGLASWLGLVALRHDIVAATGLIVAMVLVWRFFR